MNENIINARVTFHNSPIQVLEKFIFKDLGGAYSSFKEKSGLSECVIVQTCNRIELFGSAKNCDIERIKNTWASLAGLEKNSFEENLELSQNKEACQHLLQLTSGLDSMVLGEEQIIGQIKESIAAARSFKASGKRLNVLFDKAIRTGTRIRNSTGIGRGGISIGSMAVKIAEENVDDMKSKRILLIGTGEAATLVAKSLKKRGYSFFISSRTIQRSGAFSATIGVGKPIGFEDVLSGFEKFDVVFVATVAPYFLVTHEKISKAMKQKQNGMMILDLSNPRTVDEKVATVTGIKMINLDQISEMVDKNMRSRMQTVSTVQNIIDEELPMIEASMNRLDAEPIVKQVFKDVDSLRIKELQKALQMLRETDKERIKIIEELTKAVVESIVSAPMNNLRKASEQGNPDLLKASTKLFDYNNKEE